MDSRFSQFLCVCVCDVPEAHRVPVGLSLPLTLPLPLPVSWFGSRPASLVSMTMLVPSLDSGLLFNIILAYSDLVRACLGRVVVVGAVERSDWQALKPKGEEKEAGVAYVSTVCTVQVAVDVISEECRVEVLRPSEAGSVLG